MKVSHDSEILAEGQQVVTACAFIHRIVDGKEKVFLPKRADTKKFLPGVYELPGGHVDFGEDPVTGLKREINEEFGVDVEVGDPFFVFSYVNDIKKSHSFEIIYFAKFLNDPGDIILQPEDHSGYLWLAEDELDQSYTETKGADDIEQHAIRKGFAILKGEPLNY